MHIECARRDAPLVGSSTHTNNLYYTRISFKTIPPNFCSARQLTHSQQTNHPPHQCAHASELKSIKAERLLLRQLSSQAHPASEPNPASKLRRISESFHSRPSSALVLIAPSRARSCPNSAVIPYPTLSPHRPPHHACPKTKTSRHPRDICAGAPGVGVAHKTKAPPATASLDSGLTIGTQMEDSTAEDGGHLPLGRPICARCCCCCC